MQIELEINVASLREGEKCLFGWKQTRRTDGQLTSMRDGQAIGLPNKLELLPQTTRVEIHPIDLQLAFFTILFQVVTSGLGTSFVHVFRSAVLDEDMSDFALDQLVQGRLREYRFDECSERCSCTCSHKAQFRRHFDGILCSNSCVYNSKSKIQAYRIKQMV